jgi:hypothetical protein
MKTKTDSKNRTKKSTGKVAERAASPKAKTGRKVQRDAKARSRGDAPSANSRSERSPKTENL